MTKRGGKLVALKRGGQFTQAVLRCLQLIKEDKITNAVIVFSHKKDDGDGIEYESSQTNFTGFVIPCYGLLELGRQVLQEWDEQVNPRTAEE